MAKVSTYLNFPGNTEEAFNFYRAVFNTEFSGQISRFGDMPPTEGAPPMPPDAKNMIMHIELPTIGNHSLMGTDAPESMGFNVTAGNNIYIMLEPDTKEDTKRFYDALSQGGKVEQELQDTFWGAYYGSCVDKFGVQWMFNCYAEK